MSIITLTVNPALDKSTSVNELEPEKKLRCASPTLEPGGGGINVSRAIKKLTGDSTAIYLAGGYTGKILFDLLEEENVSQLQIPTKSATRENFIVTVVNKATTTTDHQYRFGMPGEYIQEEEWKSCLNYIENLIEVPQYLIASGSLPTGIPVNFYAQLATICKNKGIRLVLDTTEEALMEALKVGVYLIKPNIHELSDLVGKSHKYITHDLQESLAKELIEKGMCEVVVASLGEKGAMLVANNVVEYVTPPTIHAKSTVGAGDSMVGGMVLALTRGCDLEEVLKYGVACGTATTMQEGTKLCELEDVEEIFKGLRIKKFN